MPHDAETAWQADVRAHVSGGNERVVHQELTDASSEADVFNEAMR